MSRAAPAAPNPTGVYVLVDDDPRWGADPVDQARAALAGGAGAIQLRAKHATDREQIAWGREIARLARGAGAPFFVNDRYDLALACGADGVHLGQDDLPPARIPPRAREQLQIGRSTHTLAQARTARTEPIDYLAYGPVFGTTSKASAYDARGIEGLRQVCEIAGAMPVVAIGGIDVTRCAEVIRAGAAAVCVISAVAGAEDPRAATAALAQACEGGRG